MENKKGPLNKVKPDDNVYDEISGWTFLPIFKDVILAGRLFCPSTGLSIYHYTYQFINIFSIFSQF